MLAEIGINFTSTPLRGQPTLLAAGSRLQEQAFGPLSRERALESLRCPRHMHGNHKDCLKSLPSHLRVDRLMSIR